MKRPLNIALFALWVLVAAGWLVPPAVQLAKAELAQVLIPHAWEKTLATGQNHKPWPWADTWPVAKLKGPSGDVQYVLAHASGQSLAFGPSLLPLSVAPQSTGTVALAAHRDTHFAYLEDTQHGDRFTLQRADGSQTEYHVVRTEVVDSSNNQLYFQEQYSELKLVTCYPFNALASGGPLRYVVTALPV